MSVFLGFILEERGWGLGGVRVGGRGGGREGNVEMKHL